MEAAETRNLPEGFNPLHVNCQPTGELYVSGVNSKVLEFSGIGKFADAPLKGYSDGMVMRLGFSVVIHTDPDILLVDEVIAVGDQAYQRKCYDRIAQFQADGKTIVLVSHDMEAVRRVANRVIWLDGGRIAADGAADEVVAQYLSQTMTT